MKTLDPERRKFLKLVAGTAAALPLGYSLLAQADAALPHLSADDPSAKALGYTENAGKIDPARETAYKKGSKCGSCALYQAAQAKGGYAPCAAFPGKSVNANGWCRAYAAKPA